MAVKIKTSQEELVKKVRDALKRVSGNHAHAARNLGIPAKTFRYWAKKYGVDEEFKTARGAARI